ncbi:hypothetical protein DFH09DRAFT_1089020 [Mycena vulgaris]|nr:hypothetical protein DFH09DRAFT_1089020 [Mycena vulgaris]
MRDWGDTEGLRRGREGAKERKEEERQDTTTRLRGVALQTTRSGARAAERLSARPAHGRAWTPQRVERARGTKERERTKDKEREDTKQPRMEYKKASGRKGGEEEEQEKRKEGARGLRIVSYRIILPGKGEGRALMVHDGNAHHVEGGDPTTVHVGRLAEGSARGMKNRHRATMRRTTLKEGRESRIVWDGDSGAKIAGNISQIHPHALRTNPTAASSSARHITLRERISLLQTPARKAQECDVSGTRLFLTPFASLSPSAHSANRRTLREVPIWLEERQGREGEVRGEKRQGRTRACGPSRARFLPAVAAFDGWKVREEDITSSSGIGIAGLLRLPHRSRHAALYASTSPPTSSSGPRPRPPAARSLSLRSLSRFLSLLSPFCPAAACARAAFCVRAVRFACASETASGTSEPASSSSESRSGAAALLFMFCFSISASSEEAAEDEGRGQAGGVVERAFFIGGGVILGKEEARKRKGESENWGFGRTSSRAATHMSHAARRTDVQYGGAPTRLKPPRTRRRALLIGAAACLRTVASARTTRFAYVRTTGLGASGAVPLSESCSVAVAGELRFMAWSHIGVVIGGGGRDGRRAGGRHRRARRKKGQERSSSHGVTVHHDASASRGISQNSTLSLSYIRARQIK